MITIASKRENGVTYFMVMRDEIILFECRTVFQAELARLEIERLEAVNVALEDRIEILEVGRVCAEQEISNASERILSCVDCCVTSTCHNAFIQQSQYFLDRAKSYLHGFAEQGIDNQDEHIMTSRDETYYYTFQVFNRGMKAWQDYHLANGLINVDDAKACMEAWRNKHPDDRPYRILKITTIVEGVSMRNNKETIMITIKPVGHTQDMNTMEIQPTRWKILRDGVPLFDLRDEKVANQIKAEIERLESRIKDLEKTVDELAIKLVDNETFT